jgi:hypothetical protein
MSDSQSIQLCRRLFNCLKAASNAEDPAFQQLWMNKAEELRVKYDKLKDGKS